MTWPMSIIPDYRSDRTEEHVGIITDAVRELQRIGQGAVTLAGLGSEEKPNVDTAVVEILDSSSSTVLEVDNPLGREPIGVVSIGSVGAVYPRFSNLDSGVSITAGSRVVTQSVYSFDSGQERGYLLYADGSGNIYRIKILSYDSTSQITLQDSAPANGVGTALVQWHWDTDLVHLFLTNQGSSLVLGYWRLLFF